MFPPDLPEAKIHSLEFPVDFFLFLKAEVYVSCLGQFSCIFLRGMLCPSPVSRPLSLTPPDLSQARQTGPL